MSALRELNESVHRGSISTSAPGTNFARVALALARTGGRVSEAVADAVATWGERSVPAQILRGKAAVAIGTTQDGNWAAAMAENRVAAAEFITALRPLTILGRMSGYRRVPMQTKIQRQTASATVGWVGEARPTPVTTIALDTIELDNFKIAGIVVATNELIRLSSPAVDGLVRADLLAAVAAMIDRALLDPAAAAVAGVSPASITNGALQVASTGTALSNVAADLKALFAELTANGIPLAAPYFLMAPQTAVALSMVNTSGAGFINLDTRGGSTIATVPVLTSTSVASTIIVLLDAAELIVCDTDEIELDLGRHASIQLNTTPDYPATASTVATSLFQTNLAAWRVVRPINWAMRRAHAVATLTGVAY